jgi:dihydrofolate reductase
VRPRLLLVAAMDLARGIGRENALPWHLPRDLRRFRSLTLGKPLIVGRKTYESIGKPLPDRRNIVVSRNADLQIPGCEAATSLDAAIALARQNDQEPRVIGGSELYRAALPLATKLLVTEIHEAYAGDVTFPAYDAAEWLEESRVAAETPNVQFVTLVRASAASPKGAT